MAFLDNSGDIILDAVLTDTGRMRLARGDGSFRIAKFALSDDEIDYRLFRNSNHPDGAHPSGSAYYDLEIMQTPVLEAFTNNTSLMKHKLMSMPQTNLLYLPSVKLNNKTSTCQPVIIGDAAGIMTFTAASGDVGTTLSPTKAMFVVAADNDTFKAIAETNTTGIIPGSFEASISDKFIRVDQGLDTEAISNQNPISSELRETQYIMRVDDRLLKVTARNSNVIKRSSFVDDDLIASYYFSSSSEGAMGGLVSNLEPPTLNEGMTERVIAGPSGTRLEFSLLSTMDVESSKYLFQTIGGSSLLTDGNSYEYLFIDTSIRITGATTGSSIDIPVRIMKLNN